jgi:hypothetical protein
VWTVGADMGLLGLLVQMGGDDRRTTTGRDRSRPAPSRHDARANSRATTLMR